jgi:hypothetical protein
MEHVAEFRIVLLLSQQIVRYMPHLLLQEAHHLAHLQVLRLLQERLLHPELHLLHHHLAHLQVLRLLQERLLHPELHLLHHHLAHLQ